MHKLDSLVAGALISFAVVLVAAPLALPSAIRSGTFQKLLLSDEARYRELCPPLDISYSPELSVPPKIFCFWQCLFNLSCIFLTHNNTCSLWSFDLDANYEAGGMSPPFTPAHWVTRSSTPPPLDVALGKPVVSAGNYSPPSMLTGGSASFTNRMEDCFCSLNTNNWVVVDLETSMPVKKIIITGPAFGDTDFFKDVTIRVGDKGDGTDPVLATTPARAPSFFQKFTYSVSTASIRFIWVRPENTNPAICLCKIQAYL